MNDKFNFLKKLSYQVHKLKGDKPFSLDSLIQDTEIVKQYKPIVDNLIIKGFFFLQKTEKGLYKKTYRIPEICNRTLIELQKENINPKILKFIESYPMILHTEFDRWLNTKHHSMLSYILDKYWHNFMLYSYEYKSWCYDNFGMLIHHVPTPDYENEGLIAEDIIKDHIAYFNEYRKHFPITKTILLYNFPYKLVEEKLPFKNIKNIIFDLISEISETSFDQPNINIKKMNGIVKQVKKSIKNIGYIVLRNTLDLQESTYLNKQLGTIINVTNIEVNNNSDRKFNSYKPMSLHTDAHDVDFVSWFCQKQDLIYGEILLKNLKEYKSYFTKDELQDLKKIQIKYPIYKKFYTGEYPLLKKGRIYYADWLEKEVYSEKQINLLNKFKEFMNQTDEISILLNYGDILIIDNAIIIHGRNAIEENSKRLLYRTHISK